MATLDALPPDQRAVLQLVLQRGRSYDDIAQLLSIDRAAVRQRALAAFDALGPPSPIEPMRRALITDYLLGQLPARVSEATRERLAVSPGERAWARVLASELAPLAAQGLPEIPSGANGAERPVREDEPIAAAAPPATPIPPAAPRDEAPAREAPARPRQTPPREEARPSVLQPAAPRSSRRGGAILLALGALVVSAVVILVIALGSSGSSSTSSTTTPASTTPTTGTTTTPQTIGSVTLTSPTGDRKVAGVARVVREGSETALVIAAAGLTPNTKHDAYAVWLYSSPTQAKLVGFANPGVGANGQLSAAGALPANAGQYSQLLVTLETQAQPQQPGKVILRGPLAISP